MTVCSARPVVPVVPAFTRNSQKLPEDLPSATRAGRRKRVPANCTVKVGVPNLKQHKGTGQGYVEVEGRFIYFGRYDLPLTHQKYHQFVAEYMAAGRRLPVTPEAITVTELLCRFWEHALSYYRRADGTSTGEIDNFKPVIATMRALYGHCLVTEFGPLALRAVRQRLIERGLSRTTINQLINRARRMVRCRKGFGSDAPMGVAGGYGI